MLHSPLICCWTCSPNDPEVFHSVRRHENSLNELKTNKQNQPVHNFVYAEKVSTPITWKGERGNIIWFRWIHDDWLELRFSEAREFLARLVWHLKVVNQVRSGTRRKKDKLIAQHIRPNSKSNGVTIFASLPGEQNKLNTSRAVKSHYEALKIFNFLLDVLGSHKSRGLTATGTLCSIKYWY